MRRTPDRPVDSFQKERRMEVQGYSKHFAGSNYGQILYHVTDNAVFAMATDTKITKAFKLNITRSSLENLVKTFVAPLTKVMSEDLHSIPFKSDIAHRLYKLLVEPIERQLALKEKIMIFPDGILNRLPFEMLLAQPSEKKVYFPADYPSYAKDFLIHRYVVGYSPAFLVTSMVKSTAKVNSVLLFANPFELDSNLKMQQGLLASRNGWQFSPLIYATKEAKDIKKLYETRIYEGTHANKEIFFQEAARHQVLHFATHAFADTTFDAFSGLVLAATEDSTDDGLLMGYEIAKLKLNNCDLVTLSACETGRGKIIAGEGVLGLPRLFLGAGAKSILMTLWKVDDKFASELMPKFYNYYLKQGQSKANALTSAKRDILVDNKKEGNVYYQHPFYWASFTLYGDPGEERKSHLWYKASVMAAVLFLVIVILVGKRSNLKIVP